LLLGKLLGLFFPTPFFNSSKNLLERFRKIENEKSNPSIKKFFQKAKDFWKN